MSDEPSGAGSSRRVHEGEWDLDDDGIALAEDATVLHELFFSPEGVALATATAIYSKAFLETLGQRSGEGVAKLLGRLMSARKRSKKGKPDEVIIGIDDLLPAAMIVVTGDLPDEARLALLDLDVTANKVRGKTLRWNAIAGAWLPDDAG